MLISFSVDRLKSNYDELRVRIPISQTAKRNPKMKIIRCATAYIALLKDIIESDEEPITFIENNLLGDVNEMNCSKFTGICSQLHFVKYHFITLRYLKKTDLIEGLPWMNWENLGIGLECFIGLLTRLIVCNNATENTFAPLQVS